MHYLYQIIIHINIKKYVGQTIDPRDRWNHHIYESKQETPSMIINRAMKKHCFTDGVFDPTKCTFEIIACCLTQEEANELEEVLIKQENSHVINKMGYNVSNGGSVAPRTEIWKRKMSNWHASLSPEEKVSRGEALRQATLNQIATKGHPSKGKKRSPEQLVKMSQTRKNHPVEYTPELRQKMSKSHLGKKQSEELVAKRMTTLKLTCEERTIKRVASEELKCSAPGCDIIGRHKYRIINGIRYCAMHGQRLKQHGSLEERRRIAPNKGKAHSDETKRKMSGKTPHNKIFYTDEEIQCILSDTRSNRKIAKELGVTEKVIIRIKSEHSKTISP